MPDFTERARHYVLDRPNAIHGSDIKKLSAEFGAVWEEGRKAGLLEAAGCSHQFYARDADGMLACMNCGEYLK